MAPVPRTPIPSTVAALVIVLPIVAPSLCADAAPPSRRAIAPPGSAAPALSRRATSGPSLAGRQTSHPLASVHRRFTDARDYLRQNIRDYKCMLVAREHVGGQLTDYRYIQATVRLQQIRDGRVVVPFSIAARYVGPKSLLGRTVLYVDGENDGDLLEYFDAGSLRRLTMKVSPYQDTQSLISRFPITQMGVESLIERLIDRTERDIKNDPQAGNTVVSYFDNAEVNGRRSTHVRITHALREPELGYHISHLYLDNELTLPIRLETYGWPESRGGPPPLIEEYTYVGFTSNLGLTDSSFRLKRFQAPVLDFFQLTVDALSTTVVASSMGMVAAPIPRTAYKPIVERPPVRNFDAAKAQRTASELARLEGDHPLAPLVRFAARRQTEFEAEVADYSCLVIHREQVDQRLGDYRYLVAKVRLPRSDHQGVARPFALSGQFLGPPPLGGRRVLYVAGPQGDRLLVRTDQGRLMRLPPTTAVDSERLDRQSRIPIFQMGISGTLERLIARATQAIERDPSSAFVHVTHSRNAWVNERQCTRVGWVDSSPGAGSSIHQANVYIDDEFQLPVRTEIFDWPATPAGPSRLVEEFTYRDLRLNIGLADDEFNLANLD